MTMNKQSLSVLRDEIRRFAQERNWEQFHTPKNLAMALTVEAAELAEPFQWLSADQSCALDQPVKTEVAHEIADVFIYLIRLADVLGIDPVDAAFEKIKINAQKYPVDKSWGSNTKYNKRPEQ